MLICVQLTCSPEYLDLRPSTNDPNPRSPQIGIIVVKDPPQLLEAARDCTHVVVPSTVVLPPGVLEGLSLTAAKSTVLTERFMIDVITQANRHPAGKAATAVAKESRKTTKKREAKMSAQGRSNKRARKNKANRNVKRPEKESETAEASRG